MNKKPQVKKPSLSAQVEQAAFAEVDAYLRDLRPSIRKKLDSAVMSLIGLSGDYGRIQIDHCNGRSTVLESVIKNIAQEEVTALVGRMGGLELTKEEREKARAAMLSELSSQVKYCIGGLVREKARQIAQAMVDTATPKELRAFELRLEAEKAS